MLDDATPPNVSSRIRQDPNNAIYVTIRASTGAKVRATRDWIGNIHPFTASAQNVCAQLSSPVEKAYEEAVLLLLLWVAKLQEIKSCLLKYGNEERVERKRVRAKVGKDCRELVKEGARGCVDGVLQCWVGTREGWGEMCFGSGQAFVSCHIRWHHSAQLCLCRDECRCVNDGRFVQAEPVIARK